MPLVRPRAVSPGDTVAVVSTSWGGAGLLIERFHRGVQALESLGYEVRVMPQALGTSDGVREWVSGTREERLQDVHAAFEDPEVTCVLSAIGGNHSAQLLEGIDFETIRSNPKGLLWLLGHHDAPSGGSRTNRPRYLLRSRPATGVRRDRRSGSRSRRALPAGRRPRGPAGSGPEHPMAGRGGSSCHRRGGTSPGTTSGSGSDRATSGPGFGWLAGRVSSHLSGPDRDPMAARVPKPDPRGGGSRGSL